MTYHGGPVLHTVKPYLVFWAPTQGSSAQTIPSASRNLLERYLTDVAAASGAAAVDTPQVVRQYYDTSGYADAGQTFDAAQQAITDADAYPGSVDTSACKSSDVSAAYPICVSDAQIQAELQGLIANHGLPTGIGAGAPIYFVITPADVNVCYPSSDPAGSCASNAFCGYHSFVGSSGMVYAVVPSLPVTPNPKLCQQDYALGGPPSPLQEPNGDPADVMIDNLSHEMNEAITDPNPTQPAWSTSSGSYEVADSCESFGQLDPTGNPPTDPNAYLPTLGGNAIQATLFDQLIGGDQYYTQTVWSNGDGGCVPGPAGAALTAAFAPSPAAPTGTAVSFDPSASVAAAGVSSATWSFGDGATQFVTGTPAPVAHVYSQPGVYEAALTLVDGEGDVSTVTHSVTVYGLPRASFVLGTAGAATGMPLVFDARASSDPNSGARLSSYTWAFGDGAQASGQRVTHKFKAAGSYKVTLTVSDTLGLSAVFAMSVRVQAAGRIVRVSLAARAHAGAKLAVVVSQAGRIIVNGRSVSVSHGGRVLIPIKLSPAQRRALSSGKRLTIRVSVLYVPKAGPRLSMHRKFRVGH